MRTLLLLISVSLLAAGLAGCSAQARKEKHLADADRAYGAGQYDQAEVEYLNVVKADGSNAHAIARLGMIYFDQGSPVRAMPILLRAKELDSDNRDVRIRIGTYRLAIRQLAEARVEATFVLERNPQDVDAPILLSASVVQLRDIDEIRKVLDGLPAAAQAGIPVLIARGNLALQERKLKEAESIYRKAVDLDPKSGAAQLALGTFLWTQNNDLAGAEKALAAAAEFAPPRSPAVLQFVQFKVRTGDMASARKALEEITKKTPDFVAAALLLAEIASAENKLDESAAIVGRVLARDGTLPEALLLQAKLKMAKGDFAKAKEDLERMQKLYPESPQVLYTLAQASIATGDSDRALSLLSQATALAPDYADAMLLQAATNLNRGELNAAIVALKRLNALRPDLGQAKLLLAEAYRAQGNYQLATPIYEDLQKASPTNPEPAFLTGVAYSQQGKLPEARQAFARALQINPTFFPAINALVDLEIGEKALPTARKLADDFLAKNPKIVDALVLVAKVQMVQGENAAAEASLLKAISAAPDSTTPYYLLARLYLATNQQQKALANLQQAVAKKPQDTGGQLLIGILQEQDKNYAAARDSYEKVLATNPKSSIALNNLAYIYSEQLGNLDRALELAQKARELAPKETHTADTLGWILYRKKDFSRALPLLREAANGLKDSADVQYHLGMTFYMTGDEPAARAAFEQAIKLSGDFAGAAEVKKRLAVLGMTDGGASALEKAAADQKDDPIILSRLAAAYEQARSNDNAIRAYESLLRVTPGNGKASLALARLYRVQNQPAKASELLKAARTAAPEDPSIAAELGRLAYQTADYERASSLLQEATRKTPQDPELQFDFSLASYSVGKVSDAEAAAKEALKSGAGFSRAAEARKLVEFVGLAANPTQAAANSARIEQEAKVSPAYVPGTFALGALQERRGDVAAAIASYSKVIGLYPTFIPALKRLAVLYSAGTADLQKAADVAAKARESLPNDPELAKAFGVILFKRGDFARAANVLQESISQLPNDSEAQYYLGMSRAQLKQGPLAKAALEKAISLNLQAELATSARKALAEMK